MNKIPKRLHLIWLREGEAKTPFLLKLKEFYKGYEIKIWTKENIETNEFNLFEEEIEIASFNEFTKFAIETENFDALEDYFKMKILEKEGGIFIDTDMDPILRLNTDCESEILLGYESKNLLTTGFIAVEKKNKFVKSLITYYESIVNIALIPNKNVLWTELVYANYDDLEKNAKMQATENIIVHDVNAFGLWHPNNQKSYFIHRLDKEGKGFFNVMFESIGHKFKKFRSGSYSIKQSSKFKSQLDKTSKNKLTNRVWTIAVTKDEGMLTKETFEKIISEKKQRVKVHLHYDNEPLRNTLLKIYNVESVEFGVQKSKFRFKSSTTVISNVNEKYDKSIRIKLKPTPGRKNIETFTNMYNRLFNSGVEEMLLDKNVFKIPRVQKAVDFEAVEAEKLQAEKEELESKNLNRD